MASLGHVAVGMVAGRAWSAERPWGWMLAFSVLSLLPDADVIAFKLGIPYSAPFGHRGAAHSLVAALLGGVLVAVAGRGLRLPPLRLGVFATLVLASHGLLDALTDGGLGVALLWPFSHARLFAPLRLLPVSPIGARFLSARGMTVAAVELLYFVPLWAYSLWPRRASPPGERG